MKQLVLGIDAAWSPKHASGIALLEVGTRSKPKLLRVARSGVEFTNGADIISQNWLKPPKSSGGLNLSEVLDTTVRLAGRTPDIISLDIPLSPRPINDRRTADDSISSKYGSRKAGTHSPTGGDLPKLSNKIFRELSSVGYQWMNANEVFFSKMQKACFIETYPHPAIIEMLKLDERLQYKVAKRFKYWPRSTASERWIKVASALDILRSGLESRINGLNGQLLTVSEIINKVSRSKSVLLKGLEDALDAIVCALVGCEFLAGRTQVFGDQDSAIWIPCPIRIPHILVL
jgi:predicted RNase H-like nuclease